ncbi:uncharacterized protein BJ212DRAFT_90767 [Suillus subaureus]|uniref:F-box domain-containing protein n=1 Tax=Suillus subaureus TaxID=48587 RepID=A0A9P7JEY5_9AGAM|nr:uncharacterized protein BJ212DRAFT_90767 [Suillus subaureus]KAG1818434.1 hypothetical protein BJ212DRAFT_90767 [Suillus subaureus]
MPYHAMRLSCPKATPDSPAPNSKAQTEIDDKLEALEERKRALRTCRNSYSPISSIPPELLSTIFVFHVQQTQLRYIPDNPDVLSWLIVGRVCRRWREVALRTPELWVTPFLNCSKATDEMLTRSKMAPLNLKIGRRYRMDSIQKALMHMERLQSVSLLFLHGDTAGCRCIMEFINKLSSCSAPKLRLLALEVGDKQTPRVAIPIYFPAPNLCSLRIKHCDLSWASSVLTGLTVLDIQKLSPECLPTLDELISALRRMPALHTLVLEDALPTLSS